MRRENLALVSRGYNKKPDDGNFCYTASLKSGKQLKRELKIGADDIDHARRHMVRDRVNFVLNECM